ncbi:MAG: hypothetical protein RL689_1243 [Planctomycetota bacterium]
MAVERPTFHESWHRVGGLRPRLRPTVQVVRQVFRGRPWHVVQDAGGKDYFRMDASAYAFVGLLNGRRTVDECWQACCESLGDAAPTQGEVVQLLGQLYGSNLLAAEVEGETDVLLRRQRRRSMRELQGVVTNLLFLRLPLLDPDRFLERSAWMVRPLLTKAGAVAWIMLVAAGVWAVAGRFGELSKDAAVLLSADNLGLLYVTFAALKLIHELGHGYACKIMGLREGRGGEVHTLGLMFLVLVPFPYVDVSSAWLLRERRSRILVAAMGMAWEIAIAAIAAIVWSRASDGTVLKAVAQNAVWVASITTVVFNINPLLRYDGYYMLCDLLGMPNLGRRSNEFVQHLVKKHAWATPRLRPPSATPGEGPWLVSYAVVSTIYRTIVFAGIAWFIAQQFFVIGVLFALLGVTMWAGVPLWRFISYLATNPEIARVRGRAVATTLAFAAATFVLLGALPVPAFVRIEGIVESKESSTIFAGSPGFVTHATPTLTRVESTGTVLVKARNDDLLAEVTLQELELQRLDALRRAALERDSSLVQQTLAQVRAIENRLAFSREEAARLETRSPRGGTWIAPDIERRIGSFVGKGERLGVVADLSSLRVRGIATQPVAARLLAEGSSIAQIRVKGRPQTESLASVDAIVPAGTTDLPSASLTFDMGGPIQRNPAGDPRPSGTRPPESQRKGERAAEPHFEWRLSIDDPEGFLPGQRVIARFRMPDAPLLVQGWRWFRRELQARFQV